jgi:beta-lactamase class A
MAQYDDSRNSFSSTPERAEARSPWGDPNPALGTGGLQLPGEAEGGWNDGWQRPSSTARRRNEWRQHQQLTPDFGTVPRESEESGSPVPVRNAALPTFKRPLAPPPRAVSQAARPSSSLAAPPYPASPQAVPRGAGRGGLQMHPHSFQPGRPDPINPVPVRPVSGNPAPGAASQGVSDLPPNVTPLRPLPRRSAPSDNPATQAARSLGDKSPVGSEPGAGPRRSRVATTRRRLANPPLPMLYLIRLIILGVGVAAIAGTLLSVLSPSNLASSPDGGTAPAQAGGRAIPTGRGLVTAGSATTLADLRLTREMAHLKGELEQLGTLTPGLTPVAFAVDLDSGQYVDLGGTETVAAASTIKVPILVAFLQQVDAGTIALNQALVMREDHIAGGSGTMRGEAVGNEYTALEVATRMNVVSDNTATNMMIEALGGIEVLNQTFASWGLGQTLLRNPLPDLEGTNVSSAKDLALLMALVDQGGLLSGRSRDRLFSIMQRTQNGSLIPAGISDRSITANKTGDIGSVLGDVALVDVPNGKRYALAVLVQRPTNDGRASELIRRMTETVHGEMAQPVAPVGSPPAPLSPSGTAVPLRSPGEFEVQGEPGVPIDARPAGRGEPLNMAPPSRGPARNEVPPG